MSLETGGRRQFFRWLAREGVVGFDEMRGRPQLRLAELPRLPDQVLARLVPGVLPGVRILPGDQEVRAQLQGVQEPRLLFRCNPVSLFLFNSFNGRTELSQIGKDLSARTGWPEEKGFAAAKAFFFHLVALRVCAPTNAVIPGAEPGGEAESKADP